MQPPSLEDSRRVSAFVFVEPYDRVDSLTRTLRAVKEQTSPVNRIILALQAECSEEMRTYARSLVHSEESTSAKDDASVPLTVDAVCEAEVVSSLAEMSRLCLKENERCTERAHDAVLLKARQEADQQREYERSTQGARDFTLLTPAQVDSTSTKEKKLSSESSASPRGRRAKDVDLNEQTRQHERLAHAEALLPERLRTSENAEVSGGKRRASVETDQKWLWFLTVEANPTLTALAELIKALDRMPSLGLVGPKHLAVEDIDETTSRIVDIGLTLTPSHRVVTSIEPGEIDQGQADWRSDVFAVSMPGTLVREATLERLGGFDPMFASPWAEIDLSQRIWRSGERVQVVPSAVAHAPLNSIDESVDAGFRASQVLTLVKFRALGWALLTLLALPFVTLARVIRAIVQHDPGSVLREMHAFFKILVRAPRALVVGRKFRTTAPVGRKQLAPLYIPWSVSARERLSSAWTQLFSADERARMIRRSTWGISGTHHGMDNADYGRHTIWTVIVGLVSAACGVAAVRSLLRQGTISGGAFVPPSATPKDAQDAIFSSWIPTSLGAVGPSDPFVRFMGHVPLHGDTIIVGLYLLTVPLTALGAWYAAGTITRSIVVRIIATLMWVTAPPFIHAFSEGRWTLLVMHTLIPLAAQCLGRAIGLPHKVSQASVAAAAGGGLIVGIISSIQPVVGLLTLTGLVLVAPWVPGRRRRLWWFVVPTAAALLPNLLGYMRHPESLFAPAGMPFVFERSQGLEMFAFAPSTADPVAAALGMDPSWGTIMLGAAPLVVAAIGALGAPMLLHTAGTVGRICVVAAAGAFALAFLCVNIVVGIEGTEPFAAYPGGALSLAAAAVITGFVCTADAVVRRAREGGRNRKAVARVTGVLALGVTLTIAVGWVFQAPSALKIRPTTSPVIPAVASDNGLSGVRGRTLILTQDSSGVVTAEVVNGGGKTIDQASSQYAAFLANETEQGRPYDRAMAALVTATAQNLGATGTQSSSASLGDFGVTYVVVPGDVDAQSQLVDTLNTSPRFEHVTVSKSGGMWRIVDPASRASTTDADGKRVELRSERTHVVDRIKPISSERTITLAERADPRWQATVDGQELKPRDSGNWSQEFIVPAGVGGEVIISYSTPLITALIVVGYVAVAVSVLVAVPWKRRRKEQLS